LQVLGAPT